MPSAREDADVHPRPFQVMQSLNQYLARAVVRGTQKHFSALHAAYLQEKRDQMSDTLSGMTVTSQVPNPVAPRVDQKNLVTGEDSRAQAQGGTNPLKGNDLPVRGETTDQENAGA